MVRGLNGLSVFRDACVGVVLGQQVQAGSRVVSELMLMPMNRGVTEVSAVSKAFFTLV